MTHYAKTAAGDAELINKQCGLNFIERSTLLMVNGKRSIADITQSLGSLGNVDDTIAKLASLGLINGEAESVTAPAAVNYLDNIYARRAAATLLIRRALESAMGPGADMFMLKLESATDKTMFSLAVENALTVFGKARGADAKATLESKLQILPLT